MKLSRILLLFIIAAQVAQAQQISWTQMGAGVWKGVVGKPETYDLLKAAGSKPNQAALEKLGSASFPIQQNEIVATLADGKTYLRFPLNEREQLFGFGLNFVW